MSGWLFVISSAACSILIAHFLKTIESKGLDTLRVLTVNYLTAVIAAFFISPSGSFYQLESISTAPALLAVAVGLFFMPNFFIYSKSVHHNGVGISVAAMRISLIIPVLVSVMWYLEYLTAWQWTGVMLIFVTLFLLLPEKKRIITGSWSFSWLLVLIFLFTGLGDAALKVYEMEFSAGMPKEVFMGLVFTAAFFVGLICLFFRKNWMFNRDEIWMGVAIGIPNLFSALFLIEALERMNGAIVYSGVNVFIVLGGTLLGVMRWADRLSVVQWAGIFLTVISILLLI